MEVKEEKIRVAVRVRPLSDSGVSTTQVEAITASPDGQHVLVYADPSRTNASSFRCGTFLPTEIAQHDVFDEIRAPELVEAALDGFPVTIFAYGQTGAGKSYTIFGKEDVSASGTGGRGYGGGVVSETDGVLPRAAMRLMEVVDSRRDMFDYTLRVTCVEIYNEQVRDLFDTKKESLPVRHSKDHGFYLENATVVQCKTAKEIIRVVKLAATNRIKSAHLLNERSNRSHCLVTIYIDSTPRDASMGAKKYGKLTIVDLAGSERANDTGAVGQQLRETGHINKSLYCLSKVIHAMTTNNKPAAGKSKFVPYRDSKLTMLLIDSLGGNSKTLMIACVNSAPQFAVESTRTLEFAMGVAKIKNRPTAVLNPHEKLIIDLKEEIRLLKLENLMLRSRTPGYFMEHPETVGGMEPYEGYEQMATSPLGRALLSGRHRPEDLRVIQQTRLRSHGDNNHEFEESAAMTTMAATGRRAKTSEKAAMGAGLSGIKKMAAQRRNEKLSKKSKSAALKGKKKKPVVPETSHATFTLPDGSSLPPVRQNVALFHKRSPGVSLGVPSSSDKGIYRTPAPVQPPASPPPEYDDLFGIETVPVSVSNPVSNQDQHRSIKRSRSSLASLQRVDSPPTNPGDQIQKLLRDMFTPPQPTTKREAVKTTAPQLKPRCSGSGIALVGAASSLAPPQFDDARTEDLFQQLCRL